MIIRADTEAKQCKNRFQNTHKLPYISVHKGIKLIKGLLLKTNITSESDQLRQINMAQECIKTANVMLA